MRLRPVGAGRPDVAPCLFDACGGENVKGKNVLKSLHGIISFNSFAS